MADRALIIGGTGAMGSAVVRALLEDRVRDWSVALFTRDPTARRAKEMVREGAGRTTAIKGDLEDRESPRHQQG